MYLVNLTKDLMGHKPDLMQGDCIKMMKTLASGSVNLVVTDPAYESLEKHRAIGTTTRLQSWFKIFPNRRYKKLLAQIARVLAPNSHAYIMCDEETMDVIKSFGQRDKKGDLWFLTKYGKLRYWKAIVWNKKRTGQGYHYRSSKEFILFLEKGKRKLSSLRVRDVLSVTALRGKEAKRYPTAKPLKLLRILIRMSSKRDEVVLDPFMGGGSTIAAASSLGRKAIGIDISDESMVKTKALVRSCKGLI